MLNDNRASGIRHHGKGQSFRIHLLQQGLQLPNPADAVQAHRIHEGRCTCFLQQILPKESVSGISAGQHRIGDNHICIRHPASNVPGTLQESDGIGIGLEQKIFRPLFQKCIDDIPIFFLRAHLIQTGHRTDIRKNMCAIGFCRPAGQPKSRPNLSEHHIVSAGIGHPVGGKGIGLNGPGTGFQIFPVDGGNQQRFLYIRHLAALPRQLLRCGEIGAHSSVEYHRPPGQFLSKSQLFHIFFHPILL